MPEHRLLLKDIEIPDIEGIEVYSRRGGYRGAAAVLEGMTPQQAIDVVGAAGLRERGGRWSPVADEWQAVLADPAPRHYLCVNAHEAAPGLFRDRKLIERLPHRVVEGALLAAFATGSRVAYLCLRAEMERGRRALSQAIGEAQAEGWLGPDIRGSGFGVELHLHPGAGAHVGGEDTALLESLEGRRPEPRADDGSPGPQLLYGQPAAVVNVGTLGYLPQILAEGAQHFRCLGTEDFPGTCVFCVSGHVRRPGLYELELGSVSLRELIEDFAGGVRSGHQLKAVLPGGYRAPPLTPDQLDVTMAPEVWAVPGGGPFPGVFGDGGIVVMDETTCMVDAAIHLMRFYARESCGQCPPCREGASWLLQILCRLEAGSGQAGDVDLIESIASQVSPLSDSSRSTALCDFGPSFAWTIQGLVAAFREEFVHHVRAGLCPVTRDDAIKVPDSVNIRF